MRAPRLLAKVHDEVYLEILDTDISFVLSSYTWNAILPVVRSGKVILDLGCGVGNLMTNLARESDAKTLIIGVTIDRTHCKIAKGLVKKADVIRADALKAPFRNGVIFVVFSTMLIEHLDDQALTKEIHFILKKGGTLVLSTVMKEEGAKYFYKNEKGEYLLAPDHLREYKSENEVIKLLADNGLVTKACTIIPTKFSLLDGLFRLLYRNMSIEILKTIVHQKPITYLRKKTKLPIPHYYDLEIIANKNDK